MQQRFLQQTLLLAQHVSATTMPIIRSSRVLYSGCCLWYFVLWFSSCWSGVELRVTCPVCRMLQCATDLEHLYRIYSNPTHDKHQWLLLEFIVLLMMDAKGVRNMQSILVVFDKHNTARVATCWFIICHRHVMHGNSNIKKKTDYVIIGDMLNSTDQCFQDWGFCPITVFILFFYCCCMCSFILLVYCSVSLYLNCFVLYLCPGAVL